MKIGVMTIVKVNNYGAELQAFATQRKLSLMGYDAEIVDYRYYKSWNFKDSKMSVPLLPMSIKGKIGYWVKYRLINAVVEKVLPLFSRCVKNRIARFESFHKKNTNFSCLYASMDDLYSNPPKYDVYMTGSDQVWNPVASSSIEPYFLTFAPKDKKKVSYASSFGVKSIDEPIKSKIGKWLKDYVCISVRENSGLDLVKNLSGKDATWVVDPTLLLSQNEWLNVAESYPDMPSQYVLIYQLFESESIERLAKKIGNEKGIPVYRICKRAIGEKRTDGITNILDAGPAEFLSLIANAEYMVTNSFHGTAFSINFGIPFFTVVSSRKKNNSRIESLLGLVGLKNRIVLDNELIDCVDLTSSIDYEKAHNLLNSQRKISEDFIREAIC